MTTRYATSPDGLDRTWQGTALAGIGLFGPLTAAGPVAAQSPHPPHGLRWVSAVPAAEGRLRLYHEQTRADGAHELRTQLA